MVGNGPRVSEGVQKIVIYAYGKAITGEWGEAAEQTIICIDVFSGRIARLLLWYLIWCIRPRLIGPRPGRALVELYDRINICLRAVMTSRLTGVRNDSATNLALAFS